MNVTCLGTTGYHRLRSAWYAHVLREYRIHGLREFNSKTALNEDAVEEFPSRESNRLVIARSRRDRTVEWSWRIKSMRAADLHCITRV